MWSLNRVADAGPAVASGHDYQAAPQKSVWKRLDLAAVTENIVVSPTAKPWFSELVRKVLRTYTLEVPVHHSVCVLILVARGQVFRVEVSEIEGVIGRFECVRFVCGRCNLSLFLLDLGSSALPVRSSTNCHLIHFMELTKKAQFRDFDGVLSVPPLPHSCKPLVRTIESLRGCT